MSKRYAMAEPRNIEYRTIRFDARAAGKTGKISGYASHFGSVDSYGTAVQRGAFAKTLKARKERVPLLFNHDSDKPIGTPSTLREDTIGLYFNADVIEATSAGADVMALLRAGTPLGMSFGFETVKSRPVTDLDTLDYSIAPARFTTERGMRDVRVIEEVNLYEISIVTFPANEFATINDVRKSANQKYRELIIDLAESSLHTSRKSDANWILDELEAL